MEIEIHKHTEALCAQRLKHGRTSCGDYYTDLRTEEATTFFLCDGIGSGIQAHIAAVMTAHRLKELVGSGLSLLEACGFVIKTMHEARTSEIPFSAFTVIKVLNSGSATILSYESPPPVVISDSFAYLPEQRHFELNNEILAECEVDLNSDNKVLIMTDGINQAGLGISLKQGFGPEGIASCLNELLKKNGFNPRILEELQDKACALNGGTNIDDATILAVYRIQGSVLNILTGPPANKLRDKTVSEEFTALKGKKVICGSTTAEIVAASLKKDIKPADISVAHYRPPSYNIEGIDLVTEGAVTLSQTLNILDEDSSLYDPASCVSELAKLLNESTLVNIWVGGAVNTAQDSIIFRQLGVLPRAKIIALLAEKLRKKGKLVMISSV